jgi:CRP-like cAMP-binding protein
MRILFEVLKKNILFKNSSPDEIENIVETSKCNIIQYSKDSIIALEDYECSSIGIVLVGTIEIQKIYASGKIVTLTQLNQGHTFGEAIMFSMQNTYPATIVAVTNSEVLYIPKSDVIDICARYPSIMENFMELLSNKILILNKKVKELSFETIRAKICSYILELYKKQKNLNIKVPFSRKTMAEHMGIQRPSLSRELIKMRDEGIIDFDKDTIHINDLKAIEDSLV